MSEFNVIDALISLRPNAKFALRGDILSGIEDWRDDGEEPPTEAEVEAEIIRLGEEYTANEYARHRKSSYPSIGDQMDMLMKDMRDGTKTHQESCEAVKAQFTKPEGT